MEVILKKDVENLGFIDDLVEVKNGYGRNFLIPQGFAILATSSAKKVLAETMRQRAHRDAKLIEDANKVAKTLEGIVIKIIAKTADGTKLFGSVNNADVSEELAKQGHEIAKNAISIEGRNIKRTGEYVAYVRLHREVIVAVPFSIVPDPKSLVKKKKVVEEEVVTAVKEDDFFSKKESIDDVLGQMSPKTVEEVVEEVVEETPVTEETPEVEATETTETEAETEE